MDIEKLKVQIQLTIDKKEKTERTLEKLYDQINASILNFNLLLAENEFDLMYDDFFNGDAHIQDFTKVSFFDKLYSIYYKIITKKESFVCNAKKVKIFEENLKTLNEQLNIENAKLQYLQDEIPQVIKDFMLNWKNQVVKYFKDLSESYEVDLQKYQSFKNKKYFEYELSHPQEFPHIKDFDPSENYITRVSSYKTIREIECQPDYVRVSESFYAKYQDPMFKSFKQNHFDLDWLDKETTKTMNKKLINLMQRVSKITGKIINADLYIKHGDLNGIIYGESGTCRIETIDAGGYNNDTILDSGRHGQIYHFRVLVKKL